MIVFDEGTCQNLSIDLLQLQLFPNNRFLYFVPFIQKAIFLKLELDLI